MKSLVKIVALGLGVLLLCSMTAFFGMVFVDQVIFTPPVWPTYTPQNVQEICRLFPTQNPAFCTNLSGQNAIQLKQTLQQLFPAGQATYDDVIAYLGALPSYWWSGSKCPNENKRVKDKCPQPQFCVQEKWYTCHFSSESGNIPVIRVDFDMTTGLVTYIGVDTPGDS